MSTLADRLIAAGEYVRSLPDGIPDPSVDVVSYAESIRLAWHLSTRVKPEEQRAVAATIRRALGGTWDKEGQDSTIWLTHETKYDGIKVDLVIFADRDQVCRRIVTGTEEVTLPAVEAQPERTEVREVVEWQCDPITTDERVAS